MGMMRGWKPNGLIGLPNCMEEILPIEASTISATALLLQRRAIKFLLRESLKVSWSFVLRSIDWCSSTFFTMHMMFSPRGVALVQKPTWHFLSFRAYYARCAGSKAHEKKNLCIKS